jgi:indole-3-glycerol phosphate synthase
LLISSLFERGYSQLGLNEMIDLAHREGLEVLLETHSLREFEAAMMTEADLIGINNRDLRSLEVDIKLTESILSQVVLGKNLVVSESGIRSADDVRFLRGVGASAFLVGSSIMESHDPESKVRELVNA